MLTSQQMKKLEHDAVQQGISVEELMEKAGQQVFAVVKERYPLTNERIVVFCGPGNNGGDGFVAARYFAEEFPVLVLFFGDKWKLSEEARVNLERIEGKINVVEIKEKEDLKKFHFQKNLKYVLLDALLGTGAKGEIWEPLSSGIDLFNSLRGIKVAVDLPSGIDPDTGEVFDKCCKCGLIVCFHDLKQGLEKFKRKTVVVDIGLPDKEVKITRL